MSGVVIARALLAADATLTAAVPAARIFAGAIPLNTPLPAISVTQTSGSERLTVAMNDAKRLVTERVQVTVCAKSYPSQKALIALARKALPNSRAVINGFDCDSIIPDSEGPDVYDPTAGIYEQSHDFFVKYLR